MTMFTQFEDSWTLNQERWALVAPILEDLEASGPHHSCLLHILSFHLFMCPLVQAHLLIWVCEEVEGATRISFAVLFDVLAFKNPSTSCDHRDTLQNPSSSLNEVRKVPPFFSSWCQWRPSKEPWYSPSPQGQGCRARRRRSHWGHFLPLIPWDASASTRELHWQRWRRPAPSLPARMPHAWIARSFKVQERSDSSYRPKEHPEQKSCGLWLVLRSRRTREGSPAWWYPLLQIRCC